MGPDEVRRRARGRSGGTVGPRLRRGRRSERASGRTRGRCSSASAVGVLVCSPGPPPVRPDGVRDRAAERGSDASGQRLARTPRIPVAGLLSGTPEPDRRRRRHPKARRGVARYDRGMHDRRGHAASRHARTRARGPPAALGTSRCPARRQPGTLDALAREITACRACPRLVAWREAAAANPPARFRGEPYWARPVPGWGDAAARIVLRRAGSGGARRQSDRAASSPATGRATSCSPRFTGPASRTSPPRPGSATASTSGTSTSRPRCAARHPPTRPHPGERDRCAPFLQRELALLVDARVIVALGAFGWAAALRAIEAGHGRLARPLPRFGHAARGNRRPVHAPWHVSSRASRTRSPAG